MVWCIAHFNILNRSGMTQKCDKQTDRRTDSLVANVALNYVVRPKTDN